MLRNLVALMRPKHYLKNGLIFVPLAFSGKLLADTFLLDIFLSVVAFSAVASVVYIINDIRDVKKDQLHPKKKYRPIAAGKVSVPQALMLATLLIITAVVFGYLANLSLLGWSLLAIYLLINVAYSAGLKDVPIIDVSILASGFVIRVIYGAVAVDMDVSRWLYLTVLAGAFYLSLGKRRNEIMTNGTKSRKVNKYYSLAFLDKNMYVCVALTLVFYSLWATDPTSIAASLFWTIPLVILLLMAYSLNIEKEGSMGDPVDVFTGDKVLALLALAYVGLTMFLLYL